MRELNLPEEAYVNKFIAKTKFYEKANLSPKLQREFIDKIQRITWKYKLAESTIGITKTETVNEIQIFEIELKEQTIPKNVLKVIDKNIPYQILYKFIYYENVAYGITLKENTTVDHYYFTDWNEDISFDFTGINLEKVYQNLVKAFIGDKVKNKENFDEVIETDNKFKTLEKEIATLENKIKKEKQFNRKVELNKTLLLKKEEYANLQQQGTNDDYSH